jgi:hypothetical protein
MAGSGLVVGADELATDLRDDCDASDLAGDTLTAPGGDGGDA